MFCTKCGHEVTSQANFCPKCGAKLSQYSNEQIQMPGNGNPNGKNSKGIILVIVIGIILGIIIMSIGGLICYKLLTKNTEIEQEEIDENDEKEETFVEIETVDEKKDTVEVEDNQEKFRQYIDEVLATEFEQIEDEAVYVGTYQLGEYNNVEMAAPNVDGIWKTDIADYDGDGQNELFVLDLYTEAEDNKLEAIMYETEGGEVQQTAKFIFDNFSVIGFGDEQHVDLYTKDGAAGKYIIGRRNAYACLFADGAEYTLNVLKYDGTNFEEVLDESMVGSEFSGTEEKVSTVAEKLMECGLNTSASCLDYTFSLKEKEDQLDTLCVMDGANFDMYGSDAKAFHYYETQNLSDLGNMTYQLFNNVDSYKKAASIAAYTTEVKDFTQKQNGKAINAYYTIPYFEVDNKYFMERINKELESLVDSYTADQGEGEIQERVKEELEYLLDPNENTLNLSELDYAPRDIESVYYDEDGNVSIGFSWFWFMGGVANNGWDTFNRNVRDNSVPTIERITGLSTDQVKRKIKDQLISEWSFEEGDSVISEIDNIYYFKFYYDENKVYVCFDAYEIGQGGSGILVEIDR